MATSIAEAFQRAGIAPPPSSATKNRPQRRASTAPITNKSTKKRFESQVKPASPALARKKILHADVSPFISAGFVGLKKTRPSILPASSKLAQPAPRVTSEKPSMVKPLTMLPLARLLLNASADIAIPLAPQMEQVGRQTQALVGEVQAQHEITLGVDFGTSSVKVVIGDSALDKSFVVPFGDHEGIERYLLPSRLFQTGSRFSLAGGTACHRDLKLAFLAAPQNQNNRVRIVAFLALVIQRARAWLLTCHAQIYRHTQLFWKLSVGFPAAHYQDSTLFDLFSELCSVAWAVAGQVGPVDEPSTIELLQQPLAQNGSDQDVEVMVVPEIAAQIHGFVGSTNFDRKAQNVFLMADIGAGTVDASLFRVIPARGGKWDFEFFTSVVEHLGVSNLHRHRVDWWIKALQESAAPTELAQQLLQFKFQTDQQCKIPNSFTDYFADIEVNLLKGVLSPDDDFYNTTLAQVQGSALWRASNDNLAPPQTIEGVPFFLSGGGARMPFYRELKTSMSKPFSGYSWLYATPRVMMPPDNLVIDDTARVDYDRLSVAYGLSRLELGRVSKIPPMPKPPSPPTTNSTDRYINKDQC